MNVERWTSNTSRDLFERAKRSLAGGVSSSARATTTGPLPYPTYMQHGSGSRIWDVDGNSYVDFLLSYGCTVNGHAHPALTDALTRVLASGTMFGTCNVPEIELSELMCAMVPCAELVRYANSGSEAIQGAVRAARGHTGLSTIVKFEGHYHGWADTLAISNRPSPTEAGPYEHPTSRPHSPGIPAGVVDDVLICPWNDPDVLRTLLDAHRGEIAAVICEPIVANNACTMPLPGYLEFLRAECTRRGIVLIFDEICTGFRTGPGGAQALFGVVPDMSVHAKALGGGLPIAAFTGRRTLMDPVASNEIKHGGTYNASPLCATAALVTLTELADPATIRRIDESGRRVMDAIGRASHDHGVRCAVQGVGAMFQVVFSPNGTSTRHYRDMFTLDTERYAVFRHALLKRGIHINGVSSACWFVSSVLTAADLDQTCLAVDEAFALLA